jgi:hypothetical protein
MRSLDEVVADVRRAVGPCLEGPGPNVALVGCETFAHPRLPALVAEAFRLGVVRLRLTTAGAALAQGGNAAGAIDAGVRQVEVVVLGPEQDSGGAGPSLSAVTEGMNAFLEAGRAAGLRLAIAGRVPVCTHTVASAPATVAALAAAGAVAVTVEMGGGLERGGPDAPDAAWVRSVTDSGVVNRAWVQFEIRGDRTPSAAWSRFEGVASASTTAWTEAPLC